MIEVITRSNNRPQMLSNNRASLKEQTSDDWVQSILVGATGKGMIEAQRALGFYADHLRGDYIWILDDDDRCTRPQLFAELKRIIAEHDPDVIMLKMDHGPRGVLPDAEAWGKKPALGRVGSSAYVVRRELWQQCAATWLHGRYSTDYEFIAAVFEQEPSVYWHDVIASECQGIGGVWINR